jgi:high-affinity Fe2+/Pb2+ permease
VLPLVALLLLAALIFPGGGWLLFGVFKLLLLFWLVTCVAGFFAAGVAHRHSRHHGNSGYRRGRRDIWL